MVTITDKKCDMLRASFHEEDDMEQPNDGREGDVRPHEYHAAAEVRGYTKAFA